MYIDTFTYKYNIIHSYIKEECTIIYVVDSIMGSGKSSSAINMINDDAENKYVYITPFLSEVDRIKEQCADKRFYSPKPKEGKKFNGLHSLLLQKKNIASTHSLFERANEETKELIKAQSYILVLDEVMDVIEPKEFKKTDIEILFDNFIYIDDDGYVCWREDKQDHDSRYNDVKDMADNRSLIYYRDKFFMWTFPVDVFKAFKDVYILTYKFESQIQCYYYQLNGIEYKKLIATNENGKYIFKDDPNHSDKELKQELKKKINIYEGKLNDIGDSPAALCKNWYSKRNEVLHILKNNTENYFKNKVKAKSNEILWTTFADYKGKIRGRGYSKSFLACNSRATNEYRDRLHLAYTVNRYLKPLIYGFFHDKGVTIDEDGYALSEFIQWLWRSGIRDGKEITLYCPSSRMRSLLIKWLDDEI